MKCGIVLALIREFYINFFIQKKNELSLCSNSTNSDREERTFFELLLFYKVPLRMFCLSLCYLSYLQDLCVSLPLVSRSKCASFLVTLWWSLLHGCPASISYALITSAATRLAHPHKTEFFTRRNSLCMSLGSRHCADACVCHSVSRRHAGHCARICRSPPPYTFICCS